MVTQEFGVGEPLVPGVKRESVQRHVEGPGLDSELLQRPFEYPLTLVSVSPA